MATAEREVTGAGTDGGIPVENPATGEILATVPELGRRGGGRMVAAAREAQPGWEGTGFEGRADVLMAARAWMVANGDRVVETISGETGRPADETSSRSSATGSRRSISSQARVLPRRDVVTSSGGVA